MHMLLNYICFVFYLNTIKSSVKTIYKQEACLTVNDLNKIPTLESKSNMPARKIASIFKNTCIENYISSTVLKFLLLGTTGERDLALCRVFFLKYGDCCGKLAYQTNQQTHVNFFLRVIAGN